MQKLLQIVNSMFPVHHLWIAALLKKQIIVAACWAPSGNYALRQELFGLTILSVFYLVQNGSNLSYMAQLEMALTK